MFILPDATVKNGGPQLAHAHIATGKRYMEKSSQQFEHIGIQNGYFDLGSPGFHRSLAKSTQSDYNVLKVQTKTNLLEMQNNEREKNNSIAKKKEHHTAHTMLLRQLISLQQWAITFNFDFLEPAM